MIGVDSDVDFKTIECQIMDIADDIAYSTYDLEDCLKVEFLTPIGMLASGDELLGRVAAKVATEIGRRFEAKNVLSSLVKIFFPEFANSGNVPRQGDIVSIVENYRKSQNIAQSGYIRGRFSSELVGSAIEGVRLDWNSEFPVLSKVHLDPEIAERVAVLKNYTFEAAVSSSRVKLAEYRGVDIVHTIFDALNESKGHLLLPEDVKQILPVNKHDRMRIICDFVAGMTDRYAIEFYARLKSENANHFFKPI